MVMLFDRSKFFVTSETKVDEIVQKLNNQLQGFMRFPIESSDPVARDDRVVWSGKPNGPDDLVMCMLFGIYWSSVFMFDPQWTYLVPTLPRSTILSGAIHNAIISKYADDLHPSTESVHPKSSSSSSRYVCV